MIVLNDRQDVEDKKTIITLFLARFTLDETEVEALTSRDVPIGQRFFDAMDKTERIREDCRVLMAGEDGSTKAGCVSSFYSTPYLIFIFLKVGNHGIHFFEFGTRL